MEIECKFYYNGGNGESDRDLCGDAGGVSEAGG